MNVPLIECTDLSKQYRIGTEKVNALSHLNAIVNEGEFVSVMGPSGSGKSTFMNLIGCLDRPSNGTIRIDGRDTSTLTANELAEIRNSEVGFVFQQFNLLGRTTALDNVSLPLLYAGMARRERMDAAQGALAMVGLSDRLHHHPTQLSGGQQQRVAIARALVNHPSILLADEPTGALDSKTGLEIMELFSSLNESGLTVIVVTHEEGVAGHAERIMRFLDGRIVDDSLNQSEAV